MHSLNILSKAQINQVQDVDQKVTLHRPNSIIKVMDGLFKNNENPACFPRKLVGTSQNHSFHSMCIRENGMSFKNPTFVPINEPA